MILLGRCSQLTGEIIKPVVHKTKGIDMLYKLLSKLFIVEDDSWFVGDDQKTYSDLLDIALRTDDEEMRTASLIRIRSMAFDYIRNSNPLGYMLIAHWNALQKQTDNALSNYLRAANAGIPKATKIIDDYKLTTESNAGSCILLAEACFLNGNDQEGIRYLGKCNELGCKGVENVLQIHSKGSFRSMNSFEEIRQHVGDFKWRLSEKITLDYGKLDERHQEKTIHFCCGFAIAKGALAAASRDVHTVSISHSYITSVTRRSFTSPSIIFGFSIVAIRRSELSRQIKTRSGSPICVSSGTSFIGRRTRSSAAVSSLSAR